MSIPTHPKIYHILHVDRLQSIINDGYLWCDREIGQRLSQGTTIGMNHIKQRRLNELKLSCYPDLFVGDCVPFYFCPRSVMLYLIHRSNNYDLEYNGGQSPIIHLQSDLYKTIDWASDNNRRWVFTRSNAGSKYFEDLCDVEKLGLIKWDAVNALDWQQCKEQKQAEFLIERSFPWPLINFIGVHNKQIYNRVESILQNSPHVPKIKVEPKWYY